MYLNASFASVTSSGAVTGSNLNVSNWDTAFSWGNHANAGYLTAVPSEFLTETEGDANYLQLSGGTLTGTLVLLGVTYHRVSSSNSAYQRSDARADDTSKARLHWYGVDTGGGNTNFRHAWYDGSNYVKVTVNSGGSIDFTGSASEINIGSDRVLTTADEGTGNGLDADTLDGQHASAFLTSSSFTVADEDTNTTTISNNGSLTISGGTGIDVAVSTNTVTITSTVTDTDTNTFVNAASFNTGNGVLTLTKNNSSTVTADLDGRYLELGGGTITGNLVVEDSEVHVGDVSGDSWTRIKHAQADGYGFDWQHGNATVIVNEQGSTNEVLVLGDVDAANYSGLFGIAHSANGGTSWTKKLDLRGNGEMYIGASGTSRVFHDGYHPNADKLTTARTIALSGDLSGSASFDGSANITISAQVSNDSHNHDGRYYTESESNSRFVNVTGDSMSGDLTISGTLSATVKSFDIEHPTQKGKRLVYGVLEGNEHAVFVRGRSQSKYIELPEEWRGLVDPDSITVQLTAIGKPKTYYFVEHKNNKVRVGCSGFNWKYDYFYIVHATRVDVEPLQTVQDAD